MCPWKLLNWLCLILVWVRLVSNVSSLLHNGVLVAKRWSSARLLFWLWIMLAGDWVHIAALWLIDGFVWWLLWNAWIGWSFSRCYLSFLRLCLLGLTNLWSHLLWRLRCKTNGVGCMLHHSISWPHLPTGWLLRSFSYVLAVWILVCLSRVDIKWSFLVFHLLASL